METIQEYTSFKKVARVAVKAAKNVISGKETGYSFFAALHGLDFSLGKEGDEYYLSFIDGMGNNVTLGTTNPKEFEALVKTLRFSS